MRVGMQTGDYILWTAHYGKLSWQGRSGPLEDIVEEVAGFDGESTSDFDSHGIPLDLELVGSGLVENFHDLVDARREKLRAERQIAAEKYQRKLASKPLDLTPKYNIYLRPLREHAHLGHAPCIAARLPMDELIAERTRFEAIFGKDRIIVKDAR